MGVRHTYNYSPLLMTPLAIGSNTVRGCDDAGVIFLPISIGLMHSVLLGVPEGATRTPCLGLGSPRIPVCLLSLQHSPGHDKDGSGSQVTGWTLAGKPNNPQPGRKQGQWEKHPLWNQATVESGTWPCDLLTK